MPYRRAVILGDVPVPRLGGPQVLCVKFPVLLKGLGKAKFKGVSLVHHDFDLEPANHVLAHVEDVPSSG